MTLADLATWLNVEITLREKQRGAVEREDGFGEQQRSTLSTELRVLKAVKERVALVQGENV